MYSLNNGTAYIKHALKTVFKAAKLKFQELGNIRIKILTYISHGPAGHLPCFLAEKQRLGEMVYKQ